MRFQRYSLCMTNHNPAASTGGITITRYRSRTFPANSIVSAASAIRMAVPKSCVTTSRHSPAIGIRTGMNPLKNRSTFSGRRARQ